MTFAYHADFDYEVINHVVIIYDLNQGNRSVTNDMEYVLSSLKSTVRDLGQRKIIYQDSEKMFDEVVVNAQGEFKAFLAIQETERDKALTRLFQAV